MNTDRGLDVAMEHYQQLILQVIEDHEEILSHLRPPWATLH